MPASLSSIIPQKSHALRVADGRDYNAEARRASSRLFRLSPTKKRKAFQLSAFRLHPSAFPLPRRLQPLDDLPEFPLRFGLGELRRACAGVAAAAVLG